MWKSFNDISVCTAVKINSIIHVSALLRFTEYSGEIRDQTHFPRQKLTLFLCTERRPQCSEWWIMTSLMKTSVSVIHYRMEFQTEWGTCEQCNVMFWVTTSCSSNILSSSRSREMMQTNEKLRITASLWDMYVKCSVGFHNYWTWCYLHVWLAPVSLYFCSLGCFFQIRSAASPQRIITENML